MNKNYKNNKRLQEQQEWDVFWDIKENKEGAIYDSIAFFYRKYIIKRQLSFFVKKYFKPQSEILHAGCGSGQVDIGIKNYISITALDISFNALKIYRKENKSGKLIQGTIFNIPVKNNSFDGAYNLGVFEHFTEDEINQMLIELNRVLKPNGKMIIFWPPEFGLTVIVLKYIHFFLNLFSKRKIELHPEEISKIKSKEYASRIFNKAGFKIIDYYFGIKDFFTYCIIIAEKKNDLT